MKPIKEGIDYIVDKNWQKIITNRQGAMKIGVKTMPDNLRILGFGVEVADCDDYYRIIYGRKCY